MGFEPTTACLGSKYATTASRPPAVYSTSAAEAGLAAGGFVAKPHYRGDLCNKVRFCCKSPLVENRRDAEGVHGPDDAADVVA